jgi:hypothetical protein
VGHQRFQDTTHISAVLACEEEGERGRETGREREREEWRETGRERETEKERCCQLGRNEDSAVTLLPEVFTDYRSDYLFHVVCITVSHIAVSCPRHTVIDPLDIMSHTPLLFFSPDTNRADTNRYRPKPSLLFTVPLPLVLTTNISFHLTSLLPLVFDLFFPSLAFPSIPFPILSFPFLSLPLFHFYSPQLQY